MKFTTMGAIVSLTALVSGCEETKYLEMGGCDMGGLQVKVIYRQRSGAVDFVSLDFYKDEKTVGHIDRIRYEDWIQCDDNRH